MKTENQTVVANENQTVVANGKNSIPPRSQRGVVELSMVTLMVLLAGVALLSALLYPTLNYSWMKMKFTTQYNQIRSAAETYKGVHSSFAGVSIVNLCNENILSSTTEICTATATSNPFGGSWAIAAGTNTSQTVITATAVPATNGANLRRDMSDLGTATLTGTTLAITQ